MTLPIKPLKLRISLSLSHIKCFMSIHMLGSYAHIDSIKESMGYETLSYPTHKPIFYSKLKNSGSTSETDSSKESSNGIVIVDQALEVIMDDDSQCGITKFLCAPKIHHLAS